MKDCGWDKVQGWDRSGNFHYFKGEKFIFFTVIFLVKGCSGFGVSGSGEADYVEDDATGVQSEDPLGSSQVWQAKFLQFLLKFFI